MIEDAAPPGRVAECDQLLAEQHQPHLLTVRFELGRQTGRNPELPYELAHRCLATDAGEKFVFGFADHLTLSMILDGSRTASSSSTMTPDFFMFRTDWAMTGLPAAGSVIGASRKLFGG